VHTAAVRVRFRGATDKEIEQLFKRRLARSSDTEGERKYRLPSQRQRQNLVNDANEEGVLYDSASDVEH
jgi:hypothetical protein